MVALDVRGMQVDSEQFARLVEQQAGSNARTLTFVIAGALGLSQDFLDGCRYRLSLSPMTFPHELVRCVLLEQSYRALTILRGKTYHR